MLQRIGAAITFRIYMCGLVCRIETFVTDVESSGAIIYWSKYENNNVGVWLKRGWNIALAVTPGPVVPIVAPITQGQHVLAATHELKRMDGETNPL